MDSIIKSNQFRNIHQRNIYCARCKFCGAHFKNHKSIYEHKKICPGKNKTSQKQITEFQQEEEMVDPIPKEPPIEISTFQKKLIYMMIATNMAFHHLNKQYFIDLFTFIGVSKLFHILMNYTE